MIKDDSKMNQLQIGLDMRVGQGVKKSFCGSDSYRN
jgi:hypothetical protein